MSGHNLRAIFDPVSSSSEDEEEIDEEEEKKKKKKRGVAMRKFLEEERHFSVVDKSRGALYDQFEKKRPAGALAARREALERLKKDDQATVLGNQQPSILALLTEIEQELAEVDDVHAFIAKYKEVALEQMRRAEKDEKETLRLIGIGKDLYIMAGMLVGVYRADEDYRERYLQANGFEPHNCHQEAETFLLDMAIAETDRKQTEKRRAADNVEAFKRMAEEEEQRREEEDLDREIEDQINEWEERRLYDYSRYYRNLSMGFNQSEAYDDCLQEARRVRIQMKMEREREIRSSPPRSEIDPNEINLDAIKLEDDSMYNPPPCSDAELDSAAVYAAYVAAGGRPIEDRIDNDVEMADVERQDYGEERSEQLGEREAWLDDEDEDERQHYANMFGAAEHYEMMHAQLQEEAEARARERAVRSMERRREEEEERRERIARPTDPRLNRPTGSRGREVMVVEDVEQPQPEPQPRYATRSCNVSSHSEMASTEEEEEPIVVVEAEQNKYQWVQQYKIPLSQMEMDRMIASRMKREIRMKNMSTPLPVITAGRRGDNGFDDHVVLENDTTLPIAPQVCEEFPVRGLKGILKHKEKGEPALITDMIAERLSNHAMQTHLVELQKFHVLKPRKKVKFCKHTDPRHTVRVYTMEACQVWHPELQRDVMDWGFDRCYEDRPMSEYKDVLDKAVEFHKLGGPEPAMIEKKGLSKEVVDEKRCFFAEAATLECRKMADSCTVVGVKKNQQTDGTKPYRCGPVAIPVTQRQDSILTLATAEHKPLRKEEYKEYSVAHRDYKIMLEMKDMMDGFIANDWLPQLRLFVMHAFTPLLSDEIGVKSAANAGLSHLIFADSMLDRVNTYRFPQAHFIIHQHPMTLSSSFRVLCKDVPLESILNINWFIFAYGFDEIVFQGEHPQIVAWRLIQHVQAVMSLYHMAADQRRNSYRSTITPKFLVFKLPLKGMDPKIQEWIVQFNATLDDVMKELKTAASDEGMTGMLPLMYKVVEWKAPAKKSEATEEAKASNCIEEFAKIAESYCGFRLAKAIDPVEASSYFQKRRLSAQVIGLSPDEEDRYY